MTETAETVFVLRGTTRNILMFEAEERFVAVRIESTGAGQ
jgi:hypothetical protein